MKLIALYTVTGPVVLLALVGLAVVNASGLAGLTTNDGAHGFSEIMVAYISSLTNNGQNFAGLSANSPFYNVTTALAMLAGRFALAVAALATAGLFAAQTRRPMSYGTLRTDSVTFAAVLVGTVLIVGGLSYFPALALGPIVEHLRMMAG
jgi:K+-transporting ATPase ATPase A chain